MINPVFSIMVDPYNDERSLRETIGPNERLLEATTIPKRDKRRCRVVARRSVDRMSSGDEGLQEPECAS
jgi:hypothetical protein